MSELGRAATLEADGLECVWGLSCMVSSVGTGAGGVVASRCFLFWRVGSAS